jgi:hypothetical protein
VAGIPYTVAKLFRKWFIFSPAGQVEHLQKMAVQAKGNLLKTLSELPSCPNTSYNERNNE